MALAVYDASVVVALLDAADVHHDSAVRDFTSRRENGDEIVLPASAYAEVLVRPERAGRSAASTVKAFCAEHLAIQPLLPSMAEAAASLRARYAGLRLPDAFVLATGQILDADAVATADGDWPKYAERIVVIGKQE